jgi:damage-control phosphatase, subfamily I
LKPQPECGACLIHWVYERSAAHTAPEDAPALVRRIVGILLTETSPTANLGSLCNSAVHAALEMVPSLTKHYEELKAESNENAKKLLQDAAAYIISASSAQEGFERTCFLAAAANVAPLNAPGSAYSFNEMRSLMAGAGPVPAIVGNVCGTVANASHVLYVTDNAGEIGFDSLVLSQLKAMGKHVTLVVKKNTFFEDATVNDAIFFGLDRVVEKIVTTAGFLAPGKLEPPIERALTESDLVIAKGTGSYEALKDELDNKPIIFMLKIKCPVIARQTGLDMGTMVVKLE